MRAIVLGLLMVWLCLGARAQQAMPGEAAQRERIATERRAAQTRYEKTVRECQSSFAVTSCVNNAKAERRQLMDRLAREQEGVDDQMRKRRATERSQRIADKRKAADERSAASAPQVQIRPPRQRTDPSAKPIRAARAQSAASAASAPSSAVIAEQHAASAERRRREAQARAEAVRRRNEQRNAAKPPAATLPAASAAALK